MTKEAIMAKYGLDKTHFWLHQQSGKQIISFEGIEKMIDYHNIIFDQPTQNYSKVDGEVALLINGRMLDIDYDSKHFEDEPNELQAWSFGEASKANCYLDYLWAMAEKRGKARVVMKLLKFYGGTSGFYSDVEMEISNAVDSNADYEIE